MSKKLIDEMMEKHREIKSQILALVSKSENQNMTKDKMRDEIFKLYKAIK